MKVSKEERKRKKLAKELHEKFTWRVQAYLSKLLECGHSIVVEEVTSTKVRFYISVLEDFTSKQGTVFITFDAMAKLSDKFGTTKINLAQDKDYGWYGETDILQRFIVEDITKWPQELAEASSEGLLK